MSIDRLTAIVQDFVNSSGTKSFIEHAGSLNSKASFRDVLNTKLHVLLVNEAILGTLSNESIKLLKSSISTLGLKSANGSKLTDNAKAITIIEAAYNKYAARRKSLAGEERNIKVGGRNTLRLVFTNFNDVRAFLNDIGLYSNERACATVVSNLDTDTMTKVLNITNYSSKEELLALGTSELYSIISSIKQYDTSLYSKVRSSIERIAYDVGHNTPVQYEALEILSSDTASLESILIEYFSGNTYGKSKSMQEVVESVYNKKIPDKLFKTPTNEGDLVALSNSMHTDLSRALHRLELVTHKSIHVNNNGVEGKYVFTFPEPSKANQGKLESALTSMLVSKLSKYIVKTMGAHKKLVESKGSPSINDIIEDTIISKIDPKAKKVKYGTVATSTTKTDISVKSTKSTSKNKSKVTSASTIKTAPKDKLPALRNLAGRFTSVTSLMTLMNQMLHETIKKNMQRPNLHYQTGRFAKSVKVEGITRERDGALTAFLSYMRYPYATFEAGGKQGHKGYYPSRLINESAREIATKLTKERFMSVTIK